MFGNSLREIAFFKSKFTFYEGVLEILSILKPAKNFSAFQKNE